LCRPLRHEDALMDDLIVQLMQSLGLFGIALLMFGENVFPPIPSEFIMPLAGFFAATGEMSLPGAIAVGSRGSLLGTSLWYVLGRRLPRRRLKRLVRQHGPWLAMRSDDLEKSLDFFRRHGRISVLLGRMLPVVRTVISVPAGMSRMGVVSFLFYSLIGVAVWTAALAGAGWFLGSQFPQIQKVLGPLTWAVIAIALGWYVWRVIQLRREQRSQQAHAA
jgi:membrane protein DedA with SNARE-associated domain